MMRTWYDALEMRTTVDLPEDLHRQARAIARDRSWTLSQAVAWLMRRGLGEELPTPAISRDELTGLLTVRVGRIITSDEVKRFLEEEE
jgi:predicted transcriptional regulator